MNIGHLFLRRYFSCSIATLVRNDNDTFALILNLLNPLQVLRNKHFQFQFASRCTKVSPIQKTGVTLNLELFAFAFNPASPS